MITPEFTVRNGVPTGYAKRIELLAPATPVAAAERVSELVDARGYSKLALAIRSANFAAATDLVGALELLGGPASALVAADLAPLLVAAANSMTVLPTGFAIDGQSDGYTIANTFESNGLILLCFDKLPPVFAVRLACTTIAVPGTATLQVEAHLG